MIIRDKVIFLIFAIQSVAAIGYFLWNRRAEAFPSPTVVSVNATQVIDSSAEFRGRKDAPFTLVEFGDYECPPCAAAHPRVLDLLHQKKKNLKFQFRHFPLTEIHPLAKPAAEYAETFRKEGIFYEKHDELYSNKGNLKDISLKRSNIDEDAWKIAKKKVDADTNAAKTVKVQGTPTFYLCTPDGTVYLLRVPEQADSLIP